MDCNDIKELFIDYMDGSLGSDETLMVDEHLSSCEACSSELMSMKSIWIEMDNIAIEQISGNVKRNIDKMIDIYNFGMVDNKKTKRYMPVIKWLESWLPGRPMIQVAATVAVLIIGLLTGVRIGERTASKKDIVQLKTDVNQLQQVVMSSLLDQASVTERIRGLTMSSHLKNVDEQFYSTLLLLLNNDSNVNVRLAAVNTLSNFAGHKYVRHELVKSLELQTSPLVQVSLIDLLSTIREPESPAILIGIINNPEANVYVKERAKVALKQFI